MTQATCQVLYGMKLVLCSHSINCLLPQGQVHMNPEVFLTPGVKFLIFTAVKLVLHALNLLSVLSSTYSLSTLVSY